jgi:hypothetical protein
MFGNSKPDSLLPVQEQETLTWNEKIKGHQEYQQNKPTWWTACAASVV